ncbi:MAG: hypothetical protein ACPIOQ_32880, partial [Promethearchaeia archaeon]
VSEYRVLVPGGEAREKQPQRPVQEPATVRNGDLFCVCERECGCVVCGVCVCVCVRARVHMRLECRSYRRSLPTVLLHLVPKPG